MSFDKPTRNHLAKIVAACRDRLAADISDQLQSNYGLYPDGSHLDVARTEDDRRAVEDLYALLAHFEVGEPPTVKTRQREQAAYQRLVREIGFTTLNRLAALRLCEERGLVIECVRRGMESDGFQLFDRVSSGALGDRYQTYRAFVEGMYDELALDLGALFDRGTPQSRVFPSEAALSDVLAWLNDPELAKKGVWEQDETIGWVYQYYNDPKERKAMRGASSAPRSSRELAVRNQFFTPRYVVEFLTDNTLGRTWYEMRGGETRLADECRYLVKTEKITTDDTDFTDKKEKSAPSVKPVLSFVEVSVVEIPTRPKKDPRDLKILDPACGSGHFLLYAFDLLATIYEEAWADPDMPPSEETGTWLAHDYATLDALRAAVPGLILRHNLHGVDIDPRAAQIAALALWLRAQRAYQTLRLPPAGRPRITKTNVITAEPMPGDDALLDEFVATLHPPLLGELVRVVFEKMKLAGEAGTLLKIEEELTGAIADARRQWAARPKNEQLTLFPEMGAPQSEQLAFDFSGITDESFWETAEARVLDALQDYATRAANGKETRRRLFAEDAAQGFAFVELCRKRFDVVLMNPPFGLVPDQVFSFLQLEYPENYVDVYSTFVVRGEKLSANGFVGTITSRS
ncbi:MAG: Eco57I restriction-modification methylase domain-containing protein, partial [Anaerolineales bacterium]